MGSSIPVDKLADAITRELNMFSDEVREIVREESKAAAKDAVRDLKAGGPKRSGKYAKGWGASTTKEGLSAQEITVHNKNKPHLTHLLEHGHANRGGGRTGGYSHISPAREKTGEQLEKNIKKAVEGL